MEVWINLEKYPVEFQENISRYLFIMYEIVTPLHPTERQPFSLVQRVESCHKISVVQEI